MRIKYFRFFGIASLCILGLLSIFFLKQPQNVKAQNSQLLFSIIETPKALANEQKNSPASVRESEIQIESQNFAALSSNKLSIPLFDGKIYEAEQNGLEGLEVRGVQDYTWRGKLTDGDFRGDVVLTFKNGMLNGLIYSPKAVYEIVSVKDKKILIELDQSLFPECAGEIKPTTDGENLPDENLGAVPDSGDRIDVLVVYTEAVKNAVGGDAQAQSLAQGSIDSTNTAYFNSKIRQRLRLVHSQQTALTEANSLSDLRSDAATAALRDTHKADMVAMLVNSLSGCGIAYVMTNVGTGFASSAYSITLRTCAVGNLTFAHELGHNMGSTHNPENGGSAAYPFSYGHWINGNYRTVMSYSNPCTSGCSRVPQFSNPAVIFNGVPTGVADQRDNFRSLENTADTVANFRYSGSSLMLSNFSDNGFIPRNISKPLNWSTENVSGDVKIELSRDEGLSWETLNANTANDGSQIINVGGRSTKRARIRISSLNDSNVRDSSIRNIFIK